MKNRLHRTALGLVSTITLSLTAAHAQTTSTWTYDGATAANNKWAEPTSWDTNPVIPNAGGDIALLTKDITAARTLTLDGSRVVGKLVIGDPDSSHAYTLAVGTPTTGQLTFQQATPSTAFLQFTSGIAETVSAPITLNDNLRVFVTSPTTAMAKNLSGVITGSGTSLTFDNDDGVTAADPVQGAGQFNMNGTNVFTGGVTLDDVRVTTTNAKGYGTGTVTVLDGGGAWINGAVTVANNFNLKGTGWDEPSGKLGAIRMANSLIISGAVTITGDPGDSGGTTPDASVLPLASSSTAVAATINGAISGGDFMVGTPSGGNVAWTGNETLTVNAANSYGDTIVKAEDLPPSGQTTLSIGGATTNTTATLGTGNVYLIGGAAGKSAAIRIYRGGGYTLQQDVTASGNTAKTAFIADVTGTGLTLNGHTIDIGEQVRLGGNANGAILNIDAFSTINAGQFFGGNTTSSSSTVNQTGGAVNISGEVRLAHFPTETTVWNLSEGTLNLTGTPTANPFFTASPYTEDTTGNMVFSFD